MDVSDLVRFDEQVCHRVAAIGLRNLDGFSTRFRYVFLKPLALNRLACRNERTSHIAERKSRAKTRGTDTKTRTCALY